MAQILIIIEKDFQDAEVIYPLYRLREAGHNVTVVGCGQKEYKGKYGYQIKADSNIADINISKYGGVIIPGGWAPDHLRWNKDVLNLVIQMNKSNKLIASICHGAWVLVSANLLKGRTITCYKAIKDDVINAGANYVDKSVVVDNNIITSRCPDDLPDFCREILK